MHSTRSLPPPGLLLLIALAGAALVTATPARAAQPMAPLDRAAALAELGNLQGGEKVLLSASPATGRTRFLRTASPAATLVFDSGGARTVAERARVFLARYGSIFGLADAERELRLLGTSTDAGGGAHVRFGQILGGVPVFGGELRAHFLADGRLYAVNGVTVPVAGAAVEPQLGPAEARTAAERALGGPTRPDGTSPAPRLVVYSPDLTWGRPGPARLAWQVAVAFDDGERVRHEDLFVDALDGAIIDRLTRDRDALERRIHLHDATGAPLWSEGDRRPYRGSSTPGVNAAVDRLLYSSGITYRFFRNLSAGSVLSYDARSAPMVSVVAADAIAALCPNASWDGTKTNFCLSTTVDDVVAHEWTHAYTDFTDDLVYRWQPGALNEAASDIFGETIDLIDGYGSDTPGTRRSDGACSTLASATLPEVSIQAPAALAARLRAGRATFGAVLRQQQLVGRLVAAEDEANLDGLRPTDACTPITNPKQVAGNVALVDRGKCTFMTKARNVQAAGAIGMVVVNLDGTSPITMTGTDTAVSIPVASLGRDQGALLRSHLGENLTVGVGLSPGSDRSLRWLIAEDPAGGGGSAFRDLWNPSCFDRAGRKSEPTYFCPQTPDADNGGVHANSGVASHGYALLTDGGTYNGVTVRSIGLTKSAHIYWRAKTLYQTPMSDFADHADALERACADFARDRTNLPSLTALRPSGERVTADDCTQVAAAIAAVELRRENPCHYAPILQPNPPALCAAGTPLTLFSETFEHQPTGWESHGASAFDPQPSGWQQLSPLPSGRAGAAHYARRENGYPSCVAWRDELRPALKVLESPVIGVPSSTRALHLAFDHWVTTSIRDGANVKISVNGAPYQVVPREAFRFNGYNGEMYGGEGAYGRGEPAWTRTDQGSITGSWGQSQVDLSALAGPGDTVRLRFDYAYAACDWDGSLPRAGWVVDDLLLYDCPTPPPANASRAPVAGPDLESALD